MLKIHAPGSKVKIGELEVSVTAAVIHAGPRVSYEIGWWSKGDRLSALVETLEIETKPSTPVGYEVPRDDDSI